MKKAVFGIVKTEIRQSILPISCQSADFAQTIFGSFSRTDGNARFCA